jgi:hypothetical protein
MAQSLLDYGQRYQDARIQEPSIQAALVAAAATSNEEVRSLHITNTRS